MPAAPYEKHPGSAFTGPVDTDLAEARWCAIAWPVAHGNSGGRVFFVDEEGEVWVTANLGGRWSGRERPPEWDAGMPPLGWRSDWNSTSGDAAIREFVGRDGSVWKRTNGR